MTIKKMMCVDDKPTIVGEPMYIHKGRIYEIEFEDNHPYDNIVRVLNPDDEEDLRLLNPDRAAQIRWPDVERARQGFELASLLRRSPAHLTREPTKDELLNDPTIRHRQSPRYGVERFVEVGF